MGQEVGDSAGSMHVLHFVPCIRACASVISPLDAAPVAVVDDKQYQRPERATHPAGDFGRGNALVNSVPHPADLKGICIEMSRPIQCSSEGLVTCDTTKTQVFFCEAFK